VLRISPGSARRGEVVGASVVVVVVVVGGDWDTGCGRAGVVSERAMSVDMFAWGQWDLEMEVVVLCSNVQEVDKDERSMLFVL
jgi:hypothetical protein